MNEIEKYKRICICCLKVLKDKYRLMKAERLTGSGKSIYDSYTAKRRWRRKRVSHVLPYCVAAMFRKRLMMEKIGFTLCKLRIFLLMCSFQA